MAVTLIPLRGRKAHEEISHVRQRDIRGKTSNNFFGEQKVQRAQRALAQLRPLPRGVRKSYCYPLRADQCFFSTPSGAYWWPSPLNFDSIEQEAKTNTSEIQINAANNFFIQPSPLKRFRFPKTLSTICETVYGISFLSRFGQEFNHFLAFYPTMGKVSFGTINL